MYTTFVIIAQHFKYTSVADPVFSTEGGVNHKYVGRRSLDLPMHMYMF